MVKLPIIRYNDKDFTFDYRLRQLRILTDLGIKFIDLTKNETDLLYYVMSLDDENLLIKEMDKLQIVV